MIDSSVPPTEVLACPHCVRLFYLTPTVLGKKIRCRGCRQIFHVPSDTAHVPVGPAVEAVDAYGNDTLLPIAIASVKDGRDVRSCPTCGRMFTMKPAFVGKAIGCRGCNDAFRVLATDPAPAGHGLHEPVAADRPRPAFPPVAAEPVGTSASQPAPAMPPASVPSPPPPIIFEDIGDTLEALLPGESVISVVRPRNMPRRHRSADLAPVLVIVTALVGFSIVLATALIQGRGYRWNRDIAFSDRRVITQPITDRDEGDKHRHNEWTRRDSKKTPPFVDNRQTDELPAEAKASLEARLQDVFSALKSEDFTAADRAIKDAAAHAGHNREARARVERWRHFIVYAKAYSGHRDQALANANQGREYEVDGDIIVVSEAGPEYVKYRRSGTNVHVPRRALDPRVEMAIVGTWFAGKGLPMNHVYLGVRSLCFTPPDRDRARREWRTAEARGAPVGPLLPILDEPVIH